MRLVQAGTQACDDAYFVNSRMLLVNLDQMEGIQICVLILLIRLVDFHDCFKCLMFFWPAEQDEVEQQEGKRK